MNGAMAEIPARDFDLQITLNCGQVFHWLHHGAGWLGMIGDELCYAEQSGVMLKVTRSMKEKAKRYFALDHALPEIYATLPEDDTMQAALGMCRGLRLIRQPAWECVATFITSTQKAAPHITQMSHALRRRYGREIVCDGVHLHTYPTAESIASLSEEVLRGCGLGYRAKNLLLAARQIASGEVCLDKVAEMDDEAAVVELCKLGGVGPKVANCILLFAYERLRAFPIDVWIERVLRRIYFVGKRRVTPLRMKKFAATYFGPYGGYAQQYLFHYARATRGDFGQTGS